MLINIIANIILIPRLNIFGASIAFLCSHGFMFISGLYFANKIIKYDKKYLIIKFVKTLIASLFMVFAIFYLKEKVSLVLSILSGGAVYAIVLLLIKGFTKEDAMQLLLSLRKKAV